jgi:hypothetical protein
MPIYSHSSLPLPGNHDLLSVLRLPFLEISYKWKNDLLCQVSLGIFLGLIHVVAQISSLFLFIAAHCLIFSIPQQDELLFPVFLAIMNNFC